MSSNVVPQGLFGPGILILTRNDISNGTPFNVGYAQEFSYDLSGETKELYGQNQFPLLQARGTIKATGKAKAATFSGQAWNSVFTGQSWTAGTQYDMYISPSTAIPTTPYQITPTIPSSGTFFEDLGVVNASTNEPFIEVASSPSAGQYSVSAGVYTFSSADHTSGISVIITLAYSYTSAPGQSMIVTNQPIGTTPSFQLDYKTALYGATYYVHFYAAVASKWSMAHKLTDFALPEYDFGFFQNASGQVLLISQATQA